MNSEGLDEIAGGEAGVTVTAFIPLTGGSVV